MNRRASPCRRQSGRPALAAHGHFRAPDVHVRVGDYKFDNTQLRGGGFGGGSRYDLERFPLENSYPLLRRYFWLDDRLGL